MESSQRRAGDGGRSAPGFGLRGRSDVADSSPRPRDLSTSLLGDAETCSMPRIRVERVASDHAEEEGDADGDVESSPRTPEHRIFNLIDPFDPCRPKGLRPLIRRRRSTGTDLAELELLMAPDPVPSLVDLFREDEGLAAGGPTEGHARPGRFEDGEGETSDNSMERWSKRFREEPDFFEPPPAPRRKRLRVVDRRSWGPPRHGRGRNGASGFGVTNLETSRLARLGSGVSEQTPREVEVDGPALARVTVGPPSVEEGRQGGRGREAGDGDADAASETSSSPCTLTTSFTA